MEARRLAEVSYCGSDPSKLGLAQFGEPSQGKRTSKEPARFEPSSTNVDDPVKGMKRAKMRKGSAGSGDAIDSRLVTLHDAIELLCDANDWMVAYDDSRIIVNALSKCIQGIASRICKLPEMITEDPVVFSDNQKDLYNRLQFLTEVTTMDLGNMDETEQKTEIQRARLSWRPLNTLEDSCLLGMKANKVFSEHVIPDARAEMKEEMRFLMNKVFRFAHTCRDDSKKKVDLGDLYGDRLLDLLEQGDRAK